MEISQFKDRSLLLSQKKYIRDFFLRHGIKKFASVTTPIIQEVKLSKSLDENAYDSRTQFDYRTLLKELMYLMV